MPLTLEIPGSQIFAPPTSVETKLFICVSGSSESGKSTLSKTLYGMDYANRIKYLRVARELGQAKYGNSDPFNFLSRGDENEKLANARLIWQRINQLTETNQRLTVIETVKHPHLLRSLAGLALNVSLCTIYVDAQYEKRVERESAALGLDAAAVSAMVNTKDLDKASYGMGEIRQMADLIVLNDGTKTEYLEWIEGFAIDLRASYPNTSGKGTEPVEYL